MTPMDSVLLMFEIKVLIFVAFCIVIYCILSVILFLTTVNLLLMQYWNTVF